MKKKESENVLILSLAMTQLTLSLQSAPGDYDSDGKFDSAVFRPSTQTWYINGSGAGSMILTFGLGGDRPVANAFVP